MLSWRLLLHKATRHLYRMGPRTLLKELFVAFFLGFLLFISWCKLFTLRSLIYARMMGMQWTAPEEATDNGKVAATPSTMFSIAFSSQCSWCASLRNWLVSKITYNEL